VSESSEQIALFNWARLATGQYPALRLLFAVPNGGKRARITASRLQREGARRGVPDLCLPVPSGPYCGLWIELKRQAAPGKPKGRATPEQLWWLGELQAVGNCAGIAYGWDEARNMIEAYLRAE
jgi:hypothetical protein